MPSFSQRHAYAHPPEISVREELPTKLRRPIADIAARRVGAKAFHQIVVAVIDPYGIRPQPLPETVFWASMFGKGDTDLIAAIQRLEGSPWFRVYDVVEAVHRQLVHQDKQSGIPVEGAPHARAFEREINRYFVDAGIGWQLVNGEILTRGAEAFESMVKTAAAELGKDNRPTAARQIHEALVALSKRPDPNYRGAIIHGMGTLECIARDLAGNPRLTLGEVLKRYPNLLPKPVDEALSQLWGYASNEARHVEEGHEPNREDAELIVGLAAILATYLTCKHRGSLL